MILANFTVLTQLNSWSTAHQPQPGKLDVVVKRRRERVGRGAEGKKKKASKQQPVKRGNLLFSRWEAVGVTSHTRRVCGLHPSLSFAYWSCAFVKIFQAKQRDDDIKNPHFYRGFQFSTRVGIWRTKYLLLCFRSLFMTVFANIGPNSEADLIFRKPTKKKNSTSSRSQVSTTWSKKKKKFHLYDFLVSIASFLVTVKVIANDMFSLLLRLCTNILQAPLRAGYFKVLCRMK